MDVHVYTDAWHAARDTQYEVGTLGPDATERGEQRKVAWQFSSMLLLYRVSNLPDLLRLWLVKGAGSDQRVKPVAPFPPAAPVWPMKGL